MASHTEIRVGDTDWVIRVGGEDVHVKVLEKAKKASGRGYEFRCKRVGADGRVVGRNLTRGSGAFRKPGESPKTTGFSKNKPKAKPRTHKRASAPKPRPRPQASAFFSEIREPGTPGTFPSNGKPSGLGSLRGRGRRTSYATSSPARTAAVSSSSQARREIEKQIKHAGLQPLVAELVKELVRCDGTEHAAQQIYGRVMGEYRMCRYTGRPFGRR
jgi:hypothetical protein